MRDWLYIYNEVLNINFKQLTFLLFIGADIAYSDMAQAMNNNDDGQKFISPLAIVRQLNDLQDSNSHLTNSVSSLKEQLDQQRQDNLRLTKMLEET